MLRGNGLQDFNQNIKRTKFNCPFVKNHNDTCLLFSEYILATLHITLSSHAWEFKKPFIFCFITLRCIHAKINEQFFTGSFLVDVGDHLRSSIFCGPFWGSFVVSGSFAVGDHLPYCRDVRSRYCDAGIAAGNFPSNYACQAARRMNQARNRTASNTVHVRCFLGSCEQALSGSCLFNKNIDYNRVTRKIAIANLGGPVKRKIK